jgi:hypothetical protein
MVISHSLLEDTQINLHYYKLKSLHKKQVICASYKKYKITITIMIMMTWRQPSLSAPEPKEKF